MACDWEKKISLKLGKVFPIWIASLPRIYRRMYFPSRSWLCPAFKRFTVHGGAEVDNQNLNNTKANVNLIDKTIVNYSKRNRIYVQKISPYNYPASYLCWSFSEEGLKSLSDVHYQFIVHKLLKNDLEITEIQNRFI